MTAELQHQIIKHILSTLSVESLDGHKLRDRTEQDQAEPGPLPTSEYIGALLRAQELKLIHWNAADQMWSLTKKGTQEMLSLRQTFLSVLEEKAYQYKSEEMTLKSGKKSHHYVDCRGIMLDRAEREMAAILIEATIVSEGFNFDAIAGVALGGIPIAEGVAARFASCPLVYVRAEAKAHGTKKLVERPYSLQRLPLALGRVVLIEDVATTGGSAVRAVEALRDDGLYVEAVIALVDREDGAGDALAAAGVRFIHIYTLKEIADANHARGLSGG